MFFQYKNNNSFGLARQKEHFFNWQEIHVGRRRTIYLLRTKEQPYANEMHKTRMGKRTRDEGNRLGIIIHLILYRCNS